MCVKSPRPIHDICDSGLELSECYIGNSRRAATGIFDRTVWATVCVPFTCQICSDYFFNIYVLWGLNIKILTYMLVGFNEPFLCNDKTKFWQGQMSRIEFNVSWYVILQYTCKYLHTECSEHSVTTCATVGYYSTTDTAASHEHTMYPDRTIINYMYYVLRVPGTWCTGSAPVHTKHESLRATYYVHVSNVQSWYDIQVLALKYELFALLYDSIWHWLLETSSLPLLLDPLLHSTMCDKWLTSSIENDDSYHSLLRTSIRNDSSTCPNPSAKRPPNASVCTWMKTMPLQSMAWSWTQIQSKGTFPIAKWRASPWMDARFPMLSVIRICVSSIQSLSNFHRHLDPSRKPGTCDLAVRVSSMFLIAQDRFLKSPPKVLQSQHEHIWLP